MSSVMADHDNHNKPSNNAALQSKDRHSVIKPEHIARTWKVGLRTSQETL